MKKQGILNSHLSKVFSDLGHTDTICVADCGLPVPNGVEKIDLALTYGVPSFIDTLKIIEKDLAVEEVTLAVEIKESNKELLEEVQELFKGIKVHFISHSDFKKKTAHCKAIVRTGENTPYANIILHSNVYFGTEV